MNELNRLLQRLIAAEAVRAHAVEIELFGQRARVISVADLIRAKEALARPKDRVVALELRALRDHEGG